MDIKGVLLQWFITFLRKKASGSGIKNEDMSDHKWVEELHKPIIKKMKKKIQPVFIDNN